MDWQWVTGLDFEKIANAIIILLTGFLAAFGFRRGKGQQATPASRAPTVEVAGALVDSSSVNRLAGELAGQSLAMTAHTMALKAQTEAVEEQTRAILDHKEEMQELRNEMARRR